MPHRADRGLDAVPHGVDHVVLEPRERWREDVVDDRFDRVEHDLDARPRLVDGPLDAVPHGLDDVVVQPREDRAEDVLHERHDRVEDDLDDRPCGLDRDLDALPHDLHNSPQQLEVDNQVGLDRVHDEVEHRLDVRPGELDRRPDPIPRRLDVVLVETDEPVAEGTDRLLQPRPCDVHEPVHDNTDRRLDSGPRLINNLTEPLNIVVRHDQRANKQNDARDYKANRVSPERGVKALLRQRQCRSHRGLPGIHRQLRRTHNHGTRLPKVRGPPSHVVRNNRKGDSRDHWGPRFDYVIRALRSALNTVKDLRKLLNAVNNRVRHRLDRRSDRLQRRHQRSADRGDDVVLRDLELIAERLRRRRTTSKRLLEVLTSRVLHHGDNIFKTNSALRRHLIDLVHRHTEVLSETRDDGGSGPRQFLQRVQ